jgi:hypothetical protein
MLVKWEDNGRWSGDKLLNLTYWLIFCENWSNKCYFLCHSWVVPFFAGKDNCFKSDRNTVNFI